MTLTRRAVLASSVFGLAAAIGKPAVAQKRYDPGASDTEIKVGNIMPYSGPASVFGVQGKTEAAYFNKVNAEGGINGRKVTFISYDDGYSPPKTVEQARKLVESDEVLLIFSSVGTPTNTAIQKYMNAKKVPQLFVGSQATKWNDPKHFPWTMRWGPSYQSEARIYAQYLLQHHPQGTIGVLYQNDDYGRDHLKGLKDGLSGKMRVIAEAPYESQDPTVESQILLLKNAGADVFFDVSLGKFASQAIRKVAEIGWKPVHILNNVSASIGAVLRPAGLDNAKGILSSGVLKDPNDATWKDDPGVQEWRSFLERYYPDADRTNNLIVAAYTLAQTLVQVLKQCGDDLTRENVMRQAANLKDLHFGMMRPGIMINTSPTDFAPVKQLQMQRFDGERWEPFGPVINGEDGAT